MPGVPGAFRRQRGAPSLWRLTSPRRTGPCAPPFTSSASATSCTATAAFGPGARPPRRRSAPRRGAPDARRPGRAGRHRVLRAAPGHHRRRRRRLRPARLAANSTPTAADAAARDKPRPASTAPGLAGCSGCCRRPRPPAGDPPGGRRGRPTSRPSRRAVGPVAAAVDAAATRIRALVMTHRRHPDPQPARRSSASRTACAAVALPGHNAPLHILVVQRNDGWVALPAACPTKATASTTVRRQRRPPDLPGPRPADRDRRRTPSPGASGGRRFLHRDDRQQRHRTPPGAGRPPAHRTRSPTPGQRHPRTADHGRHRHDGRHGGQEVSAKSTCSNSNAPSSAPDQLHHQRDGHHGQPAAGDRPLRGSSAAPTPPSAAAWASTSRHSSASRPTPCSPTKPWPGCAPPPQLRPRHVLFRTILQKGSVEMEPASSRLPGMGTRHYILRAAPCTTAVASSKTWSSSVPTSPPAPARAGLKGQRARFRDYLQSRPTGTGKPTPTCASPATSAAAPRPHR